MFKEDKNMEMNIAASKSASFKAYSALKEIANK